MADSKSNELGPLENAPAYRVYRLSRLLRHNLRRILGEAGLDVSPEQYFMLYKLYQKDGVPQAQLADPAFGDYPNMTRMIDGLEKKGLVLRNNDPKDRRRYLIMLTDKGKLQMAALQPIVAREREQINTAFSNEEIMTLMEYLGRFQRLLES